MTRTCLVWARPTVLHTFVLIEDLPRIASYTIVSNTGSIMVSWMDRGEPVPHHNREKREGKAYDEGR
jgi:hypothetical protein